MAVIIERVWIRRRGTKLKERELSGHAYQAWLDEWKNRQADGWDVSVVVDRDCTHNVAMAFREEEW